jgi:hypothetical protein
MDLVHRQPRRQAVRPELVEPDLDPAGGGDLDLHAAARAAGVGRPLVGDHEAGTGGTPA